MHSESFKCTICGMALTNSWELTRHRIAVHMDKMFQCQSCTGIFDSRQEFEKHSTEVHGSGSQSSNFGMKHQYEEKVDDTESMLMKRSMEEEKARKRTRGPYRKSAAA